MSCWDPRSETDSNSKDKTSLWDQIRALSSSASDTVTKAGSIARLRAKILYKENVIQEYKRKCGEEMWDYLVAQDSTGAEGVFRRFYGKVEEVTMNIRTLQDEIVRLENDKKPGQS